MEGKQRKQKLRILHLPRCFISSNLKVLTECRDFFTTNIFSLLPQLVKVFQNFHFLSGPINQKYCSSTLVRVFFHDRFLKWKYLRNNLFHKCFCAQNISLRRYRREIVKTRNYFCEIKYY